MRSADDFPPPAAPPNRASMSYVLRNTLCVIDAASGQYKGFFGSRYSSTSFQLGIMFLSSTHFVLVFNHMKDAESVDV